jgi:cell division protein FtsW (lipid II flippase)
MLGLGYMAVAGAPTRYLGINLGALVIGLMMLGLLRRVMVAGRQWGSRAIIAMAAVLLATALLGERAEGAARWVNLAGLSTQPSLILLPVMLVAFVRTSSVLSTMGVIVSATALAIQPDRAMAGMLAAGLAVLMVMRPDKRAATAFVASIAGFVATLVRADALPAAPYVDQILFSAFESHIAAGAAVLSGSFLLLVPAIVGWRRDPVNRATYAVFGAVWFAGIMAAALGNYPTPIVGYGGSAIIGYAMSLLALPKPASGHGRESSRTIGEANTPPDRHLLVALA